MNVNMLERFWLQVKGMRTLFFVPLAGYYCLVPLGVWAMSNKPEFVLVDAISEMCYLVVPFLSTWWRYLVMREYIEGDGREVLLLGKGMASGAFLFWQLNSICFIPLLWVKVDERFENDLVSLAAQLILISFVMNGLALFLSSFTKSITMSMLVIILYSALSNYTFHNAQFTKVFSPVQLTLLRDAFYDESGRSIYMKFILAGTVFWVLGVARCRKME